MKRTSIERAWTAGVSLLCAGALVASGCSAAARIDRRDGSTVRAEVEANDDQYIYLEDLGPMPRAEIIDIHHPGRGRWITGVIMLGVGALTAIVSGIALANVDCGSFGGCGDEGTFLGTLVVGVGVAAVGGLLFGTGLSDEQSSIDAANWNGPPAGLAYAPPPPVYTPQAQPPPPLPAAPPQSPEAMLRAGLDQRREAILVCTEQQTAELVVAYSSSGQVTFSLAGALAGSSAEACVRTALGPVTVEASGTGGAFTHPIVPPLDEAPPPPPPGYDVAPDPSAPPWEG